MFVSFLVPVYNTEKYLERCLDSLLQQTGCDFEIVLLDDGSTDSSSAICDRYAAQHPHIVRVIHKENEGLLMTRRRGFLEAKGDWFICVDSDDFVAPDLLSEVVSTIQSTDADMVMYNFEYFDSDGIHRPSRLKLQDGTVFEGESKQQIYKLRLLSVDVNMMWMRAIKRELLDFDKDYSCCGIRNMCEDAVQVLPLYTNAQKIVYINKPLYYYRKGADSITANMSLSHWQASQALFACTQPFLSVWNVPSSVEAQYYTKHLEHLCNYLRWLFSVSEQALPASLQEMLVQLKNAPDYVVCRQNYQKKYAHSRYLSVLTPILTRYVERENVRGIRFVLGLEKRLTNLRCRLHRK